MIAAIALIFWIIWIVRLASCKGRIKKKNRFILKKLEEIRTGHRKILEYEELLESAPGLLKEEEAGIHQQKRLFNKLEAQVRQTKIYLNQKVTKDDLANLIGVERNSFDALFKDMVPDESPSQWLDSFRIEYAMDKLRALKVELSKKPRPSQDDSAQAAVVRPDKEKRLEKIARESGFSGKKAMDRACRTQTGMSVGELMKILRP